LDQQKLEYTYSALIWTRMKLTQSVAYTYHTKFRRNRFNSSEDDTFGGWAEGQKVASPFCIHLCTECNEPTKITQWHTFTYFTKVCYLLFE